MIVNQWVFVVLIIICVAGLGLGVLYYLKPEKIVTRRVKSHHWELCRKDEEFKKWVEAEIQAQVNRTKRMGMIIFIIEAIWLVLIVSLWQKNGSL